MKKVNVHEHEAALYLVYSYQKDEFHEAIEKAILKAYKKKSSRSPIKILDAEKAIILIKQVLKKFSSGNKKRGRKTDQRAERANFFFQAELEKANLTIVEFRLKPAKTRQEFWDEKIWRQHEREIIEDGKFFDGSKDAYRGKSALSVEKHRIKDLVLRWNRKKSERPRKRREGKRINSRKK